MAYLSSRYRASAVDPTNRQRTGAGPVGGAATDASGTTVGTPGGVAGASGTAGGPGDLIAFFNANKGQGGAIFNGLSDSISKRIGEASTKMDQLPSQTVLAPGTPDTTHTQNNSRTGLTDTRIIPGAPAQYGVNQQNVDAKYAMLDPLGQDYRLLKSGPEGIQTLLGRDKGSDYTGGMRRLDAWLASTAIPPAGSDQGRGRNSLDSQWAELQAKASGIPGKGIGRDGRPLDTSGFGAGFDVPLPPKGTVNPDGTVTPLPGAPATPAPQGPTGGGGRGSPMPPPGTPTTPTPRSGPHLQAPVLGAPSTLTKKRTLQGWMR
jgi:hypothetical protein